MLFYIERLPGIIYNCQFAIPIIIITICGALSWTTLPNIRHSINGLRFANSNLNSGNQQSYAEHEHLALINAGTNNTTTSYGDTTNQWQHIYGNMSLANVHRHKFTLIDIYWPISPTILLLLLHHGQQQLLCQKSIAAADFRELAALFGPCVVVM